MASDWLQNRSGRQQGPRQLPGARQEGDSQTPQIRWIEAAENPWGVPVLDVRSVTLAWRSYTRDQKCAENALSFGHEDGGVFDGQISKTVPRIPASLKIPVDIEAFFPGSSSCRDAWNTSGPCISIAAGSFASAVGNARWWPSPIRG